MDNFDLKKYLAEGRLFENNNLERLKEVASTILINVLTSYPDLDDFDVLEDEYDYQRYENDDFEDIESESEWDIIKQMMYWAINKHGSEVLYISLVDDLNYDIVDDWDLELDKFGNYKDAIDYDNVFKGFKTE